LVNKEKDSACLFRLKMYKYLITHNISCLCKGC